MTNIIKTVPHYVMGSDAQLADRLLAIIDEYKNDYYILAVASDTADLTKCIVKRLEAQRTGYHIEKTPGYIAVSGYPDVDNPGTLLIHIARVPVTVAGGNAHPPVLDVSSSVTSYYKPTAENLEALRTFKSSTPTPTDVVLVETLGDNTSFPVVPDNVNKIQHPIRSVLKVVAEYPRDKKFGFLCDSDILKYLIEKGFVEETETRYMITDFGRWAYDNNLSHKTALFLMAASDHIGKAVFMAAILESPSMKANHSQSHGQDSCDDLIDATKAFARAYYEIGAANACTTPGSRERDIKITNISDRYNIKIKEHRRAVDMFRKLTTDLEITPDLPYWVRAPESMTSGEGETERDVSDREILTALRKYWAESNDELLTYVGTSTKRGPLFRRANGETMHIAKGSGCEQYLLDHPNAPLRACGVIRAVQPKDVTKKQFFVLDRVSLYPPITQDLEARAEGPVDGNTLAEAWGAKVSKAR